MRFIPLLSSKEVRREFYFYSTKNNGAHIAAISDMGNELDRLSAHYDILFKEEASTNQQHHQHQNGVLVSSTAAHNSTPLTRTLLSPIDDVATSEDTCGILDIEQRRRNFTRKLYFVHVGFDATKLVEEISINHNLNTISGLSVHKSMQDAASSLLASNVSEKLDVSTAEYCTAWMATPVHIGSVGRFVAASFYHRNESSSIVQQQLLEVDLYLRFASFVPFTYSSDSASWNTKALEALFPDPQPARGKPHEKSYSISGRFAYSPGDLTFVVRDPAHALKALKNNTANIKLAIPVVHEGAAAADVIIPVEVEWEDSFMNPLKNLQNAMGMTRLTPGCNLNSIIESVSNSYSKMKVGPQQDTRSI